MDCIEARRIYLLDQGSDIDESMFKAACGHMQGCPQCCNFAEGQKYLDRLVKEYVPTEPASAAFRERLLNSLDGKVERPFRIAATRRTVSMVLTGLAAAVLIAFGLPQWSTGDQDTLERFKTTIHNDYMNYELVDGRFDLVTSDVKEAGHWLQKRLITPVDIPDLLKANLEGVRLSNLEGQRSAVLYYRHGEEIISYFVFPKGFIPLNELPKLVTASGREYWETSCHGCTVIIWQDRHLTYTMVTTLETSKLLSISSWI